MPSTMRYGKAGCFAMVVFWSSLGPEGLSNTGTCSHACISGWRHMLDVFCLHLRVTSPTTSNFVSSGMTCSAAAIQPPPSHAVGVTPADVHLPMRSGKAGWVCMVVLWSLPGSEGLSNAGTCSHACIRVGPHTLDVFCCHLRVTVHPLCDPGKGAQGNCVGSPWSSRVPLARSPNLGG